MVTSLGRCAHDPRRPASFVAVALLLLSSGCTGATLGSGVGDRLVERPPFYAGEATDPAAVAFLPVTYQRDSEGSPGFDPDGHPDGPLARLLSVMNEHLESWSASSGRSLVGPLAVPAGTPPDIYFGCELDVVGECVMSGEADDGFGPLRPRLRLAVGRPSETWTREVGSRLAVTGTDALVVLTLEIGQYWPRQTNWRGSKAIDLGTDRTVALPWLTAVDRPVSVLQITGALVTPDGRALRIGAEGLLARRTPIVAGGVGLMSLITDEEVEELLAGGPGGAPGEPPVWQVALETLIGRLVGLTDGAAVSGAATGGSPGEH